MDNQNYSNLIEAYLNNQLSETERLDFEHLCMQDPILNSELKFQQDIIHAIQEYRKAELKQRLALIPTEGLISSYSYLKSTLVVLGLSGILITSGIFTYQNFIDKPILLNSTSKKLSQLISELPLPVEEEEVIPVVEVESNQPPIEEIVESYIPVQNGEDYSSVTQKVANVFSNLNHHEDLSKMGDVLFNENLEKDSIHPSEGELFPSAEPDIKYQYYNDRLFLHNNKSRGTLIPFEKNGLTRYYLLYEEYYYEINDNQEEIATPKVVKDVDVILELKKLQELYGR